MFKYSKLYKAVKTGILKLQKVGKSIMGAPYCILFVVTSHFQFPRNKVVCSFIHHSNPSSVCMSPGSLSKRHNKQIFFTKRTLFLFYQEKSSFCSKALRSSEEWSWQILAIPPAVRSQRKLCIWDFEASSYHLYHEGTSNDSVNLYLSFLRQSDSFLCLS